MNPLTLEWIDKAEGDYTTAGRELRARKSPNYDAVCFHAQQVAEKYLKAVLQENQQIIPRTHALLDLLAMCIKISPTFQLIQENLNILDGYAVLFRYPGKFADKIEAKDAYKNASIIRDFVRQQLDL